MLAVGGEKGTIIEDSIAVLMKLGNAGKSEAVVVYKEFRTENKDSELAPLLATDDKARPEA